MKKKSSSQSAFFSPRFLTGFALCSIGVFLAALAFARPVIWSTSKIIARAANRPRACPKFDVGAKTTFGEEPGYAGGGNSKPHWLSSDAAEAACSAVGRDESGR